MLVRFSKSSKPNVWVNTNRVSIARLIKGDEDWALSHWPCIQLIIGEPHVTDDGIILWSGDGFLEFNFKNVDSAILSWNDFQNILGSQEI